MIHLTRAILLSFIFLPYFIFGTVWSLFIWDTKHINNMLIILDVIFSDKELTH